MNQFKLGFFGSLFLLASQIVNAQTSIGQIDETKLRLFEYYNHTGDVEWIKLFTINNFNAEQGFWGKGGVSGRVYFADYQGEGGSYVDFTFPQSISAGQKPVLILNGASADNFEWFTYPGSNGPGQSYYDVYIKTPPANLGFSFLVRGNDYASFFTSVAQPSIAPSWSYGLSPESFSYFKANGNFGLGTLNPTERLSVNGKIRSKEIKVEVAGWPDYVFEREHVLPTLEETEKQIKLLGHLPGIPSTLEVKANGIDLGEMNARLLKKIEELTLHIISLEKRVKSVENLGEKPGSKRNIYHSKHKSSGT